LRPVGSELGQKDLRVQWRSKEGLELTQRQRRLIQKGLEPLYTMDAEHFSQTGGSFLGRCDKIGRDKGVHRALRKEGGRKQSKEDPEAIEAFRLEAMWSRMTRNIAEIDWHPIDDDVDAMVEAACRDSLQDGDNSPDVSPSPHGRFTDWSLTGIDDQGFLRRAPAAQNDVADWDPAPSSARRPSNGLPPALAAACRSGDAFRGGSHGSARAPSGSAAIGFRRTQPKRRLAAATQLPSVSHSNRRSSLPGVGDTRSRAVWSAHGQTTSRVAWTAR
jgi:hypothetical protein